MDLIWVQYAIQIEKGKRFCYDTVSAFLQLGLRICHRVRSILFTVAFFSITFRSLKRTEPLILTGRSLVFEREP